MNPNPHEINHWPHDDGGSGSGDRNEPDERSIEGSQEDLRRIDEELQRGGALPPEIAKRSYVELAAQLSEALGDIGIYNADEIDSAMLVELPDSVLEKLTPFTAECLYFATYNRSRKWLGNEPITPQRVFSLAVSLAEKGKSPEEIHKRQEGFAIKQLNKLGCDPDQLLELVTGEPEQVQTLIRLYHVLSTEQCLREYVEGLLESADYEQARDIKSIAEKAQSLINSRIAEVDAGKDAYNPESSRATWDSISQDLYDRALHRLVTNRGICTMVIKTLSSEADEQGGGEEFFGDSLNTEL